MLIPFSITAFTCWYSYPPALSFLNPLVWFNTSLKVMVFEEFGMFQFVGKNGWMGSSMLTPSLDSSCRVATAVTDFDTLAGLNLSKTEKSLAGRSACVRLGPSAR